MGYEVLDTDGDRVSLPDGALPPTDVIDLGDGVPPGGTPPPGPPPPPTAGLPPPPDPAGPQPWYGRVSQHPFSILLPAALLVGVLVGGTWVQHRTGQQEDLARRSQLTVVAVISNVDAVSGARSASFTVDLTNVGPLPVQVVPSDDSVRPTATEPAVHALGGAVEIAPEQSLGVDVRLAVDCSGRTDPFAHVAVPVRTADGEVHRVRPTQNLAQWDGYAMSSPCSSPDDPDLTAEVTGTIAHPRLVLHNLSRRPLAVALDLDHSPFVAQSPNFSVLRLTPELPQTLQPGQSTSLALTLSPWSCPRDLSEVRDSQLSPYVVLRAGVPGAPTLVSQPVGVDLSTVWGAALARECR